jgi:hypothetical protein
MPKHGREQSDERQKGYFARLLDVPYNRLKKLPHLGRASQPLESCFSKGRFCCELLPGGCARCSCWFACAGGAAASRSSPRALAPTATRRAVRIAHPTSSPTAVSHHNNATSSSSHHNNATSSSSHHNNATSSSSHRLTFVRARCEPLRQQAGRHAAAQKNRPNTKSSQLKGAEGAAHRISASHQPSFIHTSTRWPTSRSAGHVSAGGTGRTRTCNTIQKGLQ